MQEKIQSLIDRHEILKLKGLQLGEQDLFDRVALREEMADCITELRSQYQEQKQQNEVEKGKRMIELKAELDDNSKKKYTESTAEAVIRQEFMQKDMALSVLKTQTELLQNKT
jgi:hypothetical protein